MFNLKLTKIIGVSLISLQSITAFSFEMTEPELRESIRRYLSIYDNVDENTVDRFVELVNRHPDLFNHLAEIETDPEFLPYVEKYSDLKMQFTNRPIDEDVHITFSNNSLTGAIGVCDPFTRIIFLDRNFWNQYKDNKKPIEALLSHAMGLCDLDRHNLPTTVASFMNPEIVTAILRQGENLDEFFEIMYQELFSIQNTRRKYCSHPTESVCINQHLEQFENYPFFFFPLKGVGIPTLKHMTTGPALERF